MRRFITILVLFLVCMTGARAQSIDQRNEETHLTGVYPVYQATWTVEWHGPSPMPWGWQNGAGMNTHLELYGFFKLFDGTQRSFNTVLITQFTQSGWFTGTIGFSRDFNPISLLANQITADVHQIYFYTIINSGMWWTMPQNGSLTADQWMSFSFVITL